MVLFHHSALNNIKTYFGLPVKCLILLPDFNQIWSFPTDLHKSLQYQISRKSAHWDPRWYMQTDSQEDKQDEIISRFLLLTRTRRQSLTETLSNTSAFCID
jgi:hypothetical protein